MRYIKKHTTIKSFYFKAAFFYTGQNQKSVMCFTLKGILQFAKKIQKYVQILSQNTLCSLHKEEGMVQNEVTLDGPKILHWI